MIRRLPHLLTGANLFLGLAAILLSAHHRWQEAYSAILVAALLDGLDGRVARWLGCESAFGKLWDSCADFVSFGCAPAVAFALSHGGKLRLVVVVSSFVYLLCAGLRLVRFHLQPVQQEQGARWRRCFVGLPTTASGALFAAAGLAFPPGAEPFAGLHLLVLMGLSAAMVSRIHFPHPDDLMEVYKGA